ncbi:MAG: PAS domain S-box protein [bacterium]|nr:PAS domain S-box protein [bacterium]
MLAQKNQEIADRDLARLLDQIPDSLAIFQDRKIIFVNQTFKEIFEVRDEEIGDGVDVLRVIHEDDHAAVLRRYQDRMAGREVPQIMRMKCITLRGKVLHCETSGKLIEYGGKPSVLIVVRVVQDRVEAEEKLRTAHEQLKATLEALPDILFEMDRDARIYSFRAPDPELLFVTPDEFLGKLMTDILPPDAAQVVADGLEEVKKKGVCTGKTYSLVIKGERQWFEISAAAKGDLSTKMGRVVCLVRNISDRKKSELALTEKNIALNQILEHMEKTKADYRQEIWNDFSGTILPLVRKLRSKASPDCLDEVDILEESIKMIMKSASGELTLSLESLTSRESQICEMIRNGMSTKEISDELNLSEYTVSKHREHIRDKLGLRGKAMSLSTYLRLR